MKVIPDRIEYCSKPLLEKNMKSNPIEQFEIWWEQAAKIPNIPIDAACLATVDINNHPNTRIILIKNFDYSGVYFYTNYDSQKARELKQNPHACMIIFWPQLKYQIKIRGVIKKNSGQESDKYFKTRPRGAQIGAWASPQSQKLDSREQLEINYKNYETKFYNQEIPRPPHWGGMILKPNYFEFWHGQKSRLHDRFCYNLISLNNWKLSRLAP